MSDETGLMTLQDTMTLGTVFAESGYFDDAKSQAQAVVKIMAGRELGLPPIASMMGINIIQGKPALGSNLIAATVKAHPRYDYRVKQADNDACILEWYEGGQLIGESSFTMAEARTVKYYDKGTWKVLAEKWNWQNYPSDMLFARAMTRGQKRFAPDLGGGAPLYTAEELNGETERGEVIDVTPTTVQPTPQAATEPEPQQEQPTNGDRPFTPDKLQTGMRHKAHWVKIGDDYKRPMDAEPAVQKQYGLAAGRVEGLFANLEGGIRTKARHDVINFLYGVLSNKDLTKAEASALIDWTEDKDAATQEAAQILAYLAVEAGQQKMELD